MTPSVPAVTVFQHGYLFRVEVKRDRKEPLVLARSLDREPARTMASEIRGALADAFHAGYAESDADRAAVEDLL